MPPDYITHLSVTYAGTCNYVRARRKAGECNAHLYRLAEVVTGVCILISRSFSFLDAPAFVTR